MGAIIFFAICWYIVKGRDDPKVRNNVKQVVGVVPKLIKGFSLFIGLMVLLFVFMALGSGVFSAFSGFIPFIVIWAVISKSLKTTKKSKRRKNSNEYRSVQQSVNDGQGYKLTQSTAKRVKIISKFNKKYNLRLTDDQIERIMNASYISYRWEKEIYDMTQDYNVPQEWYKSDTDWLRAYLAAFPVMDIASDFDMQERVVEDSFYQVFNNMDMSSYYSVEELINAINNKYMINFDEMTFRIAHKFLRSKGHDFKLPLSGVMRNESEIDRLAREYDRMNDEGTYERNDNIPLAR